MSAEEERAARQRHDAVSYFEDGNVDGLVLVSADAPEVARARSPDTLL